MTEDMPSLTDPYTLRLAQKQLRASQKYAMALEQILSITGKHTDIGRICDDALKAGR